MFLLVNSIFSPEQETATSTTCQDEIQHNLGIYVCPLVLDSWQSQLFLAQNSGRAEILRNLVMCVHLFSLVDRDSIENASAWSYNHDHHWLIDSANGDSINASLGMLVHYVLSAWNSTYCMNFGVDNYMCYFRIRHCHAHPRDYVCAHPTTHFIACWQQSNYCFGYSIVQI